MNFRLYLSLLTFWCCSSLLSAQYVSNDPAYAENVILADSFYQSKEYARCFEHYQKAFEITTKSFKSVYNAACCLALDGKDEKASEYITMAIEGNWEMVCDWMADDEDLHLFKKSTYWPKIFQDCSDRKIAYEATINVPLRDELDVMLEKDQAQRKLMRSTEQEFGWNSPQMKELWAKQSESDSLNLARLEVIIEEYGYPGKSLVGSRTAGAAFLIIQHADPETQEKYLPLLTDAANKGEMRWSSLALLIDRIKTNKNEPQIYGSQLTRNPVTQQYEFFPIEDEINVNKRRAEVGLGPLEEYAQRFGLEYQLPVAEKKE